MVKPVSYLQTDVRWKNHNYSAKGERKTIGSAGCGPTSAAMVIATLKESSVTPVNTAEWSMLHGYKALNQGTYYSYFVPQLAAYGISAKQLNNSNLYGKSSSAAHTEALNALKQNDWVIACMGQGIWTSSGHFILLYGYENGYVYINDPASTSATRTKNTWANFAKQVKYMWSVSVPDSFKNPQPAPSVPAQTSLVAIGQQHAANFTGVTDTDLGKAKVRVLQRAMNLDYKNSISEDGIWGTKSKNKLGSHYVKYGETQYMVTAAEILMYLNGADPSGLELPGKYGNGLVKAVQAIFGGTGKKIAASDFLKLIGK